MAAISKRLPTISNTLAHIDPMKLVICSRVVMTLAFIALVVNLATKDHVFGAIAVALAVCSAVAGVIASRRQRA